MGCSWFRTSNKLSTVVSHRARVVCLTLFTGCLLNSLRNLLFLYNYGHYTLNAYLPFRICYALKRHV